MISEIGRPEINIVSNYEYLCEKVTQEILAFSNKTIATRRRFSIALSGGLTPQGIYQCMASASYRSRFKWDKIHFFFGDERWVSPNDEQSNYHMAAQALFTKVKIPPSNIHQIPTKTGTIKDSVRLYEKSIRDFFKLKNDDLPRFDLILLGLGKDGHTASIFPGNPALEKTSLVTAVSQKGIPQERITLTIPVINHAEMVFFAVSGPEKADIVFEVWENKNKGTYPANKISPTEGRICWFLDKAAAGKLVDVENPGVAQRIGLAADHGGYQLKEQLAKMLRDATYEVIDFGNKELDPDDDYPDFVVPLARAVSNKEVDRGIAICGSGVGACITANKVPGVRACMVHEKFSARQGVEDDDMNVICLGSHVLVRARAWELVEIFLASRFSNAPRHRRRLEKVAALE